MVRSWLFGETQTSESFVVMPSLTLDIDVVTDTLLTLEAWHDDDMKKSAASELQIIEPGPTPTPERVAAWEVERQLRKPRIVKKVSDYPGREYEDVSRDHVNGLSGYDRSILMLLGAGVVVDFRRSDQPTVSTLVPNFGAGRPAEIARRIQGQGVRRPRLRPMVRFLPIGVAFVGTVAALLWVVGDRPSLPLGIFGAVALCAVWVAAVLLRNILSQRYRGWFPGHRFREGSRQAVRERIVNTRAALIVGAVTTPAGAVIGWILNALLGG